MEAEIGDVWVMESIIPLKTPTPPSAHTWETLILWGQGSGIPYQSPISWGHLVMNLMSFPVYRDQEEAMYVLEVGPGWKDEYL